MDNSRRLWHAEWILECVGVDYLILMGVASLAGVCIVLVVLYRGRGPFAAVALLLAVPLPLLVGTYGAVSSLVESFWIIAQSPVAPKAAVTFLGISNVMVRPLVGAWLMLPAFLLALVGSFARSLRDKP